MIPLVYKLLFTGLIQAPPNLKVEGTCIRSVVHSIQISQKSSCWEGKSLFSSHITSQSTEHEESNHVSWIQLNNLDCTLPLPVDVLSSPSVAELPVTFYRKFGLHHPYRNCPLNMQSVSQDYENNVRQDNPSQIYITPVYSKLWCFRFLWCHS